MQKSLISAVFGLMLIIIIIESTALISTLPQAKATTPKDTLPVQASQIEPMTPVAQQDQFLSDPSVDQVDPGSLLNASSASGSEQAGLSVPTANLTTGSPDDAPVGPDSSYVQNQDAPMATSIDILPASGTGSPYVLYDTPISNGDDNISDYVHTTPQPVLTLPPVEMFEIYRNSQLWTYNRTAISYHLSTPPMTIAFNVTPQIQTDEKWIPNRDIVKIDGDDGRIINVTRPDQNSWFQVTVFDKDNNATVVQKDGYGGEYDQNPSKSIIIRDAGTYQIQFEGGYVFVDTSITVPKKGNID